VHTIEEVKTTRDSLPQRSKEDVRCRGDASAVQVYDADSYKMGAEIKVSIDADSIAYDPATHYMYVSTGAGSAYSVFVISVIDTNTAKKLRDIKINTTR